SGTSRTRPSSGPGASSSSARAACSHNSSSVQRISSASMMTVYCCHMTVSTPWWRKMRDFQSLKRKRRLGVGPSLTLQALKYLNAMGIDHTRLTYHYSGRDFRLTDVHGNIV